MNKKLNFELIRQAWENDETLRTQVDLARRFDMDLGYIRQRMKLEKWPTARDLGRMGAAVAKAKKKAVKKHEPDSASDMKEWLDDWKAQIQSMSGDIESLMADSQNRTAGEEVDVRLVRMQKAQRVLRGYLDNAEKLVDIEGKISTKGLAANQTTRNLVMILQQTLQGETDTDSKTINVNE